MDIILSELTTANKIAILAIVVPTVIAVIGWIIKYFWPKPGNSRGSTGESYGDGTVDNNFEGCVRVPTNDAQTTFHYYAVWPRLDASSDCLLWRKIGPDSWDWKQKWIFSPTGYWIDAWPPQSTLPGNESYDSCP